MDPVAYHTPGGWLSATEQSDHLQYIKSKMGLSRHTPFNEELQTIAECQNVSILEGSLNPKKKETEDETPAEKDARIKLHIRVLNEFAEEAKKSAIKMIQGKLL